MPALTQHQKTAILFVCGGAALVWAAKRAVAALLRNLHENDPATPLQAIPPPHRADLSHEGDVVGAGSSTSAGSGGGGDAAASSTSFPGAWEPGVSGPLGGAPGPRLSLTRTDGASPPGSPARPALEDLAALTHLGKLDPTEQLALRAEMQKRDVAEGEALFMEGADAEDGLFVILSGRFGCFQEEAHPPPPSLLPSPFPPPYPLRRQASASQLALDEDYRRSALCEFGKGVFLGENALLAGLCPLAGAAGARGWLPSLGTKRPATLRALEPSTVLCLPAKRFAAFALARPAAVVSIVLDCVSKQFRVAYALLVGYLRLETARAAAREPPGAFPAFSFGAPARTAPAPAPADGGHPAPVPLPEEDLRAAANRVVEKASGDVVYQEGEPAREVFVVLRGFAAVRCEARGAAAAREDAPPGFPFDKLASADFSPLGGGGGGHAPPALRLLGPGSISGGPAFLNGAAHRETLVAVTEITVAVFARDSLATSSAAAAGGGEGGGGGAFAGTPPKRAPSPLPAAAADAAAAHRAYVQMHLVLAIARSMARLTRQLLALGIQRRWYSMGERIFSQGEPSNGLFFCISGRVRVQHGAAPAAAGVLPSLQMDATAGDMVGEVSELAREKRRSSSAVAARDCELVYISRPSFTLLTARHARVYPHFTRLLARHVQSVARSQTTGAFGGGSGSPAGLCGAELACGLPYSLAAPPGTMRSLAARRRGAGAGGAARRGAAFAAPPGVTMTRPPPPPASLTAAWAAGAPALLPRHPTAPVYRTITVLPAGARGLPPGASRAFCGRLAAALAAAEGAPVGLAHVDGLRDALGPAAAAALGGEYGRFRASAWLSEAEERTRFLVLDADASGCGDGSDAWEGGGWPRICVGHSDVVLLLVDACAGGGEERYGCGTAETQLLWNHTGRAGLLRVDLVLLQDSGVAPSDTRFWLQGGKRGPVRRAVAMHHHVRPAGGSPRAGAAGAAGADADVAQLARFLAGRAVGVVLGGGGARGLAHTGLLSTLTAEGVPIDVICGTSQGAFVAAAWAKNESLLGLRAAVADLVSTLGNAPEAGSEGLLGRLWAALRCKVRYLMSTTLPYVSINDGSLFGERIKATLGATQIEDLPGPKFFCVSSNITDGALAVHYTGSLWGFVRASMSIIGVLPPVLAKDTGRLLVDGGYASNLPVDVMHVLLPNSVGLTLACDVERKNMVRELELLTARDYNDGGVGAQAVAQELSGSWLLRRALARSLCGFQYNVPHMFTLFQEVGFLRHYSAMRILFHGSLGGISCAPTPVAFDPTRDEPARSPRGKGGSPASRPRARSGGSDSGEDTLEGGGGGGGGEEEEEEEDEDEDALSPKLVYIRPDVGDFAILDYAKVSVIEAKGAAAAKKCLERYTNPRWRAPSNSVLY